MDAQIEEARQAALAVLRPTDSELEHGLALHQEALVVESYGFAPRASVDVGALRQAIQEGASAWEIQELYERFIMTRMAHDPEDRREFQEAWDAAGVTCILQNAGEECNEIATLIKRLAHFTYTTDLLRDFCARAAYPDDILAAKKEGHHCLYFSANAVPLMQHWVSVEEELAYIRILFHLGIRMMHLTYNRANPIGVGCGELNDGGLTDFGRQVIAEMNRVGVIVDVAHSGHQTSLEAARVSTMPVVASHSVVHTLSGHYRGKPDQVIRAIADTGGYIGICCVPRFLGRTRDILSFLDHIEYVVRHFGAEHVAIGTDVAYVSRRAQGTYRVLSQAPRHRTPWYSLWPPASTRDSEPSDERARRTLAWTNWPLFTVGMVQRGFSDDQIRQILGGNVIRVARAVWEGRAL